MPHDLGTSQDASTLRDYVDVVRRRRWSLASVAALVITTALVLSFAQTPIYVSTTEVLVAGPSVDPLGEAPVTPNLDTERRLASSSAAAELAADRLGAGVLPEQLLKDLSVSIPADTEFLVFDYGHPDPLVAQARSQAFAESYLELRRQLTIDEMVAASGSVADRIDALNTEFERLNRRIARAGDPAQAALLQAQANAIVGQITVLQQELSALTPSEDLRVGRIVEEASLPGSPSSPRHLLTGSLAMVLGLTLGTAVALLRERLDDRLRGRDDLERRAGTPVLAVIPRILGWKPGGDSLLAAVRDPSSVVSEAYRTLRTSLLFAASQEDIKVILVTSPNAGEGKTTTVANLGVVLANAGKRVALVSADLRRPRLHRFFELVNETGLTSVLMDEVSPASAMQRPGITGLGVLSSGPKPGNPAELLSSEAMDNLLWKLREIADFLLIDCPPVLAVADAAILAPLVDAVVIVADAQETPRGAVARARQQLDQVDARVIGAVLNNYDPTREGGRSQYQYAYQYVDTAAGGAGVREASRGRRRRG